jgi:hypothetical protein
MVATVAGIHLGPDTHANRPAANTVPDGSLYSCTTHSLVYKSNFAGNSWATWATLGGTGLSDPMTTRGDIIIRDASNATARLGRGGAATVLTSDGTDISWQAPTGGSSDPTIPTGGTLYNGTSTSGWTSFGTPDTFDADSTIAGHFYLRKASVGNNLIGAYRACGSFPKTYTLKISDMFLQANYHGAGLLIGEASPGKYWSWFTAHDGAVDTSRLFQRYAWTNATTAGANVNYNSSTNGFPQLPSYHRIVVNSSTDIELWHSMEGLIYYRLAASQNPAFTIGVFGFGINAFGSIEMKAAFDWIHES